MYDWSKELEQKTLGRVCILQLDEAGAPVLRRVVQMGPDLFDTVVLTPQCPHYYYQDIECVIVEADVSQVPEANMILAELLWVPYTVCFCLDQPCQEMESLTLRFVEGTSYDDKQVDAYLNIFSLPKNKGFHPLTVLLCHFIEQIYGGVINVDMADIAAIASQGKIAYFSAGASARGSMMRATIGACDVLEPHGPFEQMLAFYKAPADTDVSVIELATKEVDVLRDPMGMIIFGAGFHDAPQAMTYILAT